MNGTAQAQTVRHDSVTQRVVAGGAMVEGFGALATMALAIVGLAGVFSTTMAAIAAIVLGAAIVIEGGGIEWKNGRLARPSFSEGAWFEMVWGTDLQAGLAAIVLGILALLGISSMVLLSVALLAVGAAFLFSGRFLSGLAGVVLGILAVVGISTESLVLIGLLVAGAGLLFTGVGVATRSLAETASS
jgi:hypothetical protein